MRANEQGPARISCQEAAHYVQMVAGPAAFAPTTAKLIARLRGCDQADCMGVEAAPVALALEGAMRTDSILALRN